MKIELLTSSVKSISKTISILKCHNYSQHAELHSEILLGLFINWISKVLIIIINNDNRSPGLK
jgi:hypothetical protein